jgi:exopolyphosphatase/guanosine-5'-triphosphate,3'-diphosphate pyrophosphatase
MTPLAVTSHQDAPAEVGRRTVAVLDLGASAVRLVVAELTPGEPARILEEASRAVLLGADTFTHGRLGPVTIDAALKALEGFRRIMDTYGVEQYRAVATSAVREAQNRDAFVDRVRLRTGLEVEVVDGSEENRLTYVAVRETLRDDEALRAPSALLVEVGGGSADISLLRQGEPAFSGTYAIGSIRLRQTIASWHGSHEQRLRLLRRHIHNIVEDIRREMPLGEAGHFIALGGDVRFAATRVGQEAASDRRWTIERAAFLEFAEQMATIETDQLVEGERLALVEAETLVPALLVYRELLSETAATQVLVPEASLRAGLLLDLAQSAEGRGIEGFSRQVLASAEALGGKYRFDARHSRQVARLACRLFDELRGEHGLSARHRLLLEVAALLHDIGNFVSLRAHHKHSLYLLSASEIFGLSTDDMNIVANTPRYHRRALPQKTHPTYVALDRDERVAVDKMAALLRLANALDADHLQKVTELRVASEEGALVVEIEGSGDLSIERLVGLSRADFLTDVFGRRVVLREVGPRP